jgi:hypothetical protein
MAPGLVPYDFKAISALTDWRENLRWPTDPRDASGLANALTDGYLSFAASTDGKTAAVLMLSSASVLALALVYAESSHVAQAAAGRGIALAGGPDEALYLRGEGALCDLPPLTKKPVHWRPRSLHFARSIKNSAAIAGAGGFLGQFLEGPVIISRNSLLEAHVRRHRMRARFVYPENLLAGLEEGAATITAPRHLGDVIEALVGSLTTVSKLADPFAGRFSRLLMAFARDHVEMASRHLQFLVDSRRLPAILYSGTAGNYMARLAGVAVAQRGGRAVRFDHGGPSLLASCNKLGHCQVEDSVSTEVMLPSATLAKVAEKRYSQSPFAKRPVAFESGTGDTAYALGGGNKVSAPTVRRVLYVPTLLSGFWQYIVPDLPDVVSLDWQIRVAGQLANLPIDLVCKPHPEGELAGLPNPLEAVSKVSYEPFEAHLRKTDVFVLDLMSSTTFWKAMCTDIPVVYIDLGINQFDDWIRPLVAARCRIVKASYDERNLPYVEEEALEHAVCDAPQVCDGQPIRKLMGIGA